eukprot:gb/GFBE01015094.1/.p1 GENE.gb/GFBE01015094.1/~~gb/GFBE01015094.1/.p1  ORF type:complete len:686 (+),score=125.29 gb/GFBE01015094.1/:1-2058(+)
MGVGMGKTSATQTSSVQPVSDCGPDAEVRACSSSEGTKSRIQARNFCPPNSVDVGMEDMDVVSRMHFLESQLKRQAVQLQEMEKALQRVDRDGRRTVSVLQYNILASYLGRNTQPWFLYGADITAEVRESIFSRFHARGPDGKPLYSWPAYAEGILTPQQIAEVERQDGFFRWDKRSIKLIDTIRELDADVMSLVELDHYDFFARSLDDEWDSVFRKRPRQASHDGCGVFWRRSKFTLEASKGFDMVDGSDDKGRDKKDRSCLMVLLRWRNCKSSNRLVVVSTHLAKDPYNKAQTAIRVRQVTQIMAGLTDFTTMHSASECPVVFLGDLNARHFGEIRGIARTVWQIKGTPIHKFLWGASDVNTGATSITKARQCRIDCVQYLSSHMEVLEVVPVPRLPRGEVIPNDEHPSDHFPVLATFAMKDNYQKHRECARAWLECVAGREKVHPLTEEELRDAFEFFDRDKSSNIHRHDMEEACLDLQYNFNVDVQRLLLDCFPNQQISYENFLRAYEARLSCERMRSVGDLEYAFRYFAGDSSSIELSRLEAAFRDIAPISFSDAEVKEMIRRVTTNGCPGGSQETVNLRDFCEVVCRATFPNREAMGTRSFPASGGRYATKEICSRLEGFHETVSRRWAIEPLKLEEGQDSFAELPTPMLPNTVSFEPEAALHHQRTAALHYQRTLHLC